MEDAGVEGNVTSLAAADVDSIGRDTRPPEIVGQKRVEKEKSGKIHGSQDVIPDSDGIAILSDNSLGEAAGRLGVQEGVDGEVHDVIERQVLAVDAMPVVVDKKRSHNTGAVIQDRRRGLGRPAGTALAPVGHGVAGSIGILSADKGSGST